MSVLDTEADALLRGVNEDREKRCAALRASTDEQVQQIVRSARAAARRSVHQSAAQERTRMEAGLRQANARAEIEARRLEQRQSRELLTEMWERIGAALERRWASPTHRRAWIDAALGRAAALLFGREWLIECAIDWSGEERSELTRRAHECGARGVEWSLAASMPAGLKIRTTGVCIDATVPGILAQREVIEGDFLAEYYG